MNAQELAEIPLWQSMSGDVPQESEAELREEFGRNCDAAEAIIAKAQTEKRDLTAAENQECETLMARGKEKLKRAEAMRGQWQSNVNRALFQSGDGGTTASRGTVWRDSNGKPVYVLGKKDRFQDLPRANDKFAGARLGEFVKCAITGNWGSAHPAILGAMQTGSNVGGGYLVPEELSRTVIDLARAKSVVMQAGAMTVPMTSDRLTMARIDTDATFEVKGENSAFTGSDIGFGQIGFSAFTVGTLITTSRELAEDAPNFVNLVESALAAAFAAKLDHIAVNGMASSSLDGILDWTSGSGTIGETGSVGAIAWEDLAAAVVGIQTVNQQPNAYIAHPEIAGDLAALTSGDGTNSAKMWLGPPPNVAPLTQLVTSNIPNTSIIVGDFTQFVWGIRQGVQIEVSTQAGDAFAKHQLLIKCVWRGDNNAFRRDAFHRLVGITS